MKKGLLIGINYKDTNNELSGCINDVNKLKNMLEKNRKYTDITIISDDEKIKPKKNNIIKALKKIIDESKKCDEIWIHYSGHGYYIKDQDGDENDGYDEVLVPLDYDINGFIIDDELNSIISNTQCKTYVTFDCCHSGSALDLPYNLSIQKNKIIHSYELSQKNKKTSNHNIFMISGCMDDQTSEENKNQIGGQVMQMGAFTSFFIDILQKYEFNISIGKLMIEMNKYMLQNNHIQIPNFSSNHSISLNNSFFDNIVVKKNTSKREYLKESDRKIKNDIDDDNKKKIYKLVKKILKKELSNKK